MSNAPVSLPDAAPGLSRLATIQAALREHEPDAQVALDPEGGKLKVLTVLPPEQVIQVMQALGEAVEITGDENRSGGCGCGCSSQRR